MRLGVMQPYFFPYLGYFQLIAAVDRFILYDNLQYVTRSWLSRNRVLGTDRGISYLSVPVTKGEGGARICDMRIVEPGRWRAHLLARLAASYRRAPCYPEVSALIETAIAPDATRLAEVNIATIRAVARYLALPTIISADTTPFHAFEDRVASETVPDVRTARVLHICHAEGADTYVNAIGGRALYDRAVFAGNGVALWFVQTTFRPYRQRAAGFTPGLSIIDVLMECGRDGTREMLDDSVLV
jgi:hypothetical protein